MSAYVDTLQARDDPRKAGSRLFRCHLVADSRAELDAIALRLELRPIRVRVSTEPVRGIPYYMITDTERDRAVSLGAVPLLRSEMQAKLEEILERNGVLFE